MSKVETLGGSMVKLTVEISPEKFEEGIQIAYNKTKRQISIPGFRKGKAPLRMVEKIYGKEVFYEDALNEILPDAYEAAVKEQSLEVMSRPTVDVEKMEAGKPVVVTMTVAVKPEVTLGEYKGLEKPSASTRVLKADIEEELSRVAKQNARKVEVTDRAAKMDDTLEIDFEGFVEGRAFEGGKGEDYSLKLGSHSFIDTFEDQLVGKKTGESCEVNVTFPENYHEASLAGKPALFKVTVKKIQADELPEIDDEFAKDVSEFETLEDYKKDIKERLSKQKKAAAEQTIRTGLLEKAVEGASMDMPEPMVLEQCDQMINDFAQNLRYQGMDLDRYMKLSGTTLESLRLSVKPDAEKRLKENLVLEAIAKAEKIEVTDKDIDEQLKKMAESYGMELEKLQELVSDAEKENMKADLLNQKALDFLVAKAK